MRQTTSNHSTPLRIVTIGDSTQAAYPEESPMRGWGQVLERYLDPQRVAVTNAARGGRSSASFLHEGLWEEVRRMVPPPDFVLIQFGHNDNAGKGKNRETLPGFVPDPLPDDEIGRDERDWYRNNLRMYVTQSREMGAEPILLTPLERRRFSEQSHHYATNAEYAEATHVVALETGTPLIDLNAYSMEVYETFGPEPTLRLHVRDEDGAWDHTHYNEQASMLWAWFVAGRLREIPELCDAVLWSQTAPTDFMAEALETEPR